MSTSSSADRVPKAAEGLRPGLFEAREALVAGGTSGIGAAIAEAFLALGASVLATGVTDAEIEAARQVPGFKGARFAKLDVRDGDAVRALVGALPRLDHVVNCAGVIRRGQELAPEGFADVVDINLNGSMRVCAAARPRLAERGGTIVNMASMLTSSAARRRPAIRRQRAASRSSRNPLRSRMHRMEFG
jgi:NAD(P)-dependent dehydrogenase (short-subunit alcohol dehydrogenase family)